MREILIKIRIFSTTGFRTPGRGACPRSGHLLAALVVALTLAVSARAVDAQSEPDTPFGLHLSTAHSPTSSESESEEALQQAASLGGHLSYLWDWSMGREGLTNARELIRQAMRVGRKSFLQLRVSPMGRTTPPADVLGTSFSEPGVRRRYAANVNKLARLQPDYLNLAADVNLLFYVDPVEFEYFRTAYRRAYREVKRRSPGIRVGVSLHMDLFFAAEQFEIIDLLGPQDYVAFTSYPAWTVYEGAFPSIDEIPPAYYGRLRQLFPDRPVVLAEVGWPTAGRGSPEDQARFIAKLPALLGFLRPELVSWSLLHDRNPELVSPASQPPLLDPFDVDQDLLVEEIGSAGLREWSGPEKLSFAAAASLDFRPPASRVGIAPTPRNFPDHTMEDLEQMLVQTSAIASLAVLTHQWSADNLVESTRVLLDLTRGLGLGEILGLSPTTLDQQRQELDVPEGFGGGTPSFNDPLLRAAFVETASDLAEFAPAYLCLATEINLLAFHRMDEFEAFVAAYKDAYAAVKQISPSTRVFVSFIYDLVHALDEMAPDQIAEHRQVIDAFRPELDAVAITSYPGSFYDKPADLPADYYAKFRRYLDPGDEMIVMEIGWPSEPPGDPDEQTEFIERLPGLLAELAPSITAWSLLHDVRLDLLAPDHASSGLLQNDGEPKPSLAAFESAFGEPDSPVPTPTPSPTPDPTPTP